MNKEDNNFFVIKNFFNDLYMKYTKKINIWDKYFVVFKNNVSTFLAFSRIILTKNLTRAPASKANFVVSVS